VRALVLPLSASFELAEEQRQSISVNFDGKVEKVSLAHRYGFTDSHSVIQYLRRLTSFPCCWNFR
jgi:hypothetical protein